MCLAQQSSICFVSWRPLAFVGASKREAIRFVKTLCFFGKLPGSRSHDISPCKLKVRWTLSCNLRVRPDHGCSHANGNARATETQQTNNSTGSPPTISLYKYPGNDVPYNNDDLDGRERGDLHEDGLPMNASPFHRLFSCFCLLDTTTVDTAPTGWPPQ